MSFTAVFILIYFVQNTSDRVENKVHCVRIEPERTGWARLYDLVQEFDKNRIVDNKEDIDTLLVFVSLYPFKLPHIPN